MAGIEYVVSLGAEALEEINLQDLIQKRTAELEQIQKAIQGLEDTLQEKNLAAITTIKLLEQELEKLQAAGAGGSIAPETNKESIEEIIKRTREHNKKLDEETSKGKQAPSEQAKKLFAKIAQKTHPDKTNDADKIRLFELARRAKDRNDIEELTRILHAIGIQAGMKFAGKLISRLADLRKRANETLASLTRIMESEHYKIVEDYKNPRIRAYIENHYSSILAQNIKDLKAKIQAIDGTRHRDTTGRKNFMSFMWGTGAG